VGEGLGSQVKQGGDKHVDSQRVVGWLICIYKSNAIIQIWHVINMAVRKIRDTKILFGEKVVSKNRVSKT